jgi:hypothetical protein
METKPNPDPVCCPKFHPGPWDDKRFEWPQKLFLKDRVRTVFYMPLNFGAVMRRMNKKVEAVGAALPDYLCLSDHNSGWNMDIYLAVDREVPGGEMVTLSGSCYSKVYEGPFKDTGKWIKNFKETVKDKGLAMKKMYQWYTTCPKCAKKYGKNYVVFFAETGS